MTLGGVGFSYAVSLRRELSARNQHFAKKRRLPFVESYGAEPVIVYKPFSGGRRHGNFLDASYYSILANEDWRKRLTKVHTNAAKCLPKTDRRWMELDSSCSSDALLMNVFCYPDVVRSVSGILGIDMAEWPLFGHLAKVPLSSGRVDRTEIDMRLGSLLVEAKLTESDFQVKEFAIMERYRDFNEVFEPKTLPRRDDRYLSYQLIRNVLAAHCTSSSICVLLDQRRPDLLESWYAIMLSVRDPDLKTRCKVLTWQELSVVLPDELRNFLDLKYGIVPPGAMPSPILRPSLREED